MSRGKKPADRPPFAGFDSPRYTPTPDVIFDELLPDLTEAELKVLLYIVRRTFGWKKDADAISLSQMVKGIRRRDGTVLDRGTGLSESTVLRAKASLLARGIITEQHAQTAAGDQAITVYSLRWRNEGTAPLLSGDGPSIMQAAVPRLSGTQETAVQETENKNGSDDLWLLQDQLRRDGLSAADIQIAVEEYRRQPTPRPSVGMWALTMRRVLQR